MFDTNYLYVLESTPLRPHDTPMVERGLVWNPLTQSYQEGFVVTGWTYQIAFTTEQAEEVAQTINGFLNSEEIQNARH